MRELVLKGIEETDWTNSDENSISTLNCEYNRYVTRNKKSILALQLHEKIARGVKFYSLEFFPQEQAQLTETLQSSVGAFEPPLFCSVTWHVPTPLAVSPADIPALRLGEELVQHTPVLLHLAAVGLTETDVREVLHHALLRGIFNLLLLRGDGGEVHQGNFSHAVDLVKFVRRVFGRSFTVFVAGYPDGHPQSTSYQEDLQYLKEKVAAGADGIISQVVFETQKFASFVQNCRCIGISVPILPGIMPIVSYRCLERASHICKFSIPRELSDALLPIAEDDEAVREYGLHYITQLVQELLSLDCTHGVHFFTLNRPQLAVAIWQRLGIVNTVPSAAGHHQLSTTSVTSGQANISSVSS